MRSNFFLSFLQGLKLPLKLLAGWLGKKLKRTKTEHEKKLLAHVINFAPKHYSYQKSIGKDKKKSRKKNKNFYLVKKTKNNSIKKYSLNKNYTRLKKKQKLRKKLSKNYFNHIPYLQPKQNQPIKLIITINY